MSVRFAVLREGTPRCLLSVFQRSSGDLILQLRANQIQGLAEDHEDPTVQISDYRISIHTSDKSKEEINVITRTKSWKDNRSEKSYLFTSAMKQFKRFEPLYVCRYDNLDTEVNDLRSTADAYIDLGEIHRLTSIVLMVAAGPIDKDFTSPELPYIFVDARRPDYNVKQVKFAKFSLVLIWSFLTIPADNISQSFHIATHPASGPADGMSERETIDFYKEMRSELRKEMIHLVQGNPEQLTLTPLLRFGTFIPSSTEEECRAWLFSILSKARP